MSVCSVGFTWGLFIMIDWICFVTLTLEFYFSLTISLCPYASAFARSPGVLKFIGMKVLKVKNGMFLLVFHRLFVDGVVIVVLWKSFVMLGRASRGGSVCIAVGESLFFFSSRLASFCWICSSSREVAVYIGESCFIFLRSCKRPFVFLLIFVLTSFQIIAVFMCWFGISVSTSWVDSFCVVLLLWYSVKF